MNLELFHREFQSIILQLIYNNLLHLSVALNISTLYIVYSPQQSYEMELQNKRVRMKGVLHSIELRMLRRVDYLPAQNPPNRSTDGVT